jgi:two-component system sensor histidine kinase DegS
VTNQLNEILKEALTAMESGKEQLVYIDELTGDSIQRLVKDLEQLQIDIAVLTNEAEDQQDHEQRVSQRLATIKRQQKQPAERERVKAQADAAAAQAKLQVLQAQKIHLCSQRDFLERSLLQVKRITTRTARVHLQVNTAADLLQSKINEIVQASVLDQHQDMAVRIIKAQEEERLRVAREIHDGPAQMIANIILRLEILNKLFDVDIKQVKFELRDLQNLVRLSFQDIRRSIFNLRPAALEGLGLVPAVKKYVENFQKTHGIVCECQLEGEEKRLNSLLEIAVFRLIQESMNNIAKHANSKKACVMMRFAEDCLTTQVQDFGKGFNAKNALKSPGEHYGLVGMRERVELLRGQFSVQSSLSRGTCIEFTLPIF